MNNNSKIYLAGHTGLVGTALMRGLNKQGYENIITRNYPKYNLVNQQETDSFFAEEEPEFVFLAAARVGGIMANNTYRADFIYDNIQIQNNIIHSSWKYGVKKLLFLGSSCIYPKNAPQPLKEEYLLSSELEYTNEPYAIAKIAGIKMCESFNIQYGTNFISVMPTNLYGSGDNYDLAKSHVLPALIRKFYLGKCLENQDWENIRIDLTINPLEGISGNNSQAEIERVLSKFGISMNKASAEITLWGTGMPKREFLLSEELADACIFLMNNLEFGDLAKDKEEVRNTHINIGTGTDLSIKELAIMITKITGYRGLIKWDSSKPDGTPRKLMDVKKINSLGWSSKIDLAEGIQRVYRQFIKERRNDSADNI